MSDAGLAIPDESFVEILKKIGSNLFVVAKARCECDICKKEVLNTSKLIVPLFNKFGYSRTVATPICMCEECREKLAEYLSKEKFGNGKRWYV